VPVEQNQSRHEGVRRTLGGACKIAIDRTAKSVSKVRHLSPHAPSISFDSGIKTAIHLMVALPFYKDFWLLQQFYGGATKLMKIGGIRRVGHGLARVYPTISSNSVPRVS
jgi:hypothetical protein